MDVPLTAIITFGRDGHEGDLGAPLYNILSPFHGGLRYSSFDENIIGKMSQSWSFPQQAAPAMNGYHSPSPFAPKAAPAVFPGSSHAGSVRSIPAPTVFPAVHQAAPVGRQVSMSELIRWTPPAFLSTPASMVAETAKVETKKSKYSTYTLYPLPKESKKLYAIYIPKDDDIKRIRIGNSTRQYPHYGHGGMLRHNGSSLSSVRISELRRAGRTAFLGRTKKGIEDQTDARFWSKHVLWGASADLNLNLEATLANFKLTPHPLDEDVKNRLDGVKTVKLGTIGPGGIRLESVEGVRAIPAPKPKVTFAPQGNGSLPSALGFQASTPNRFAPVTPGLYPSLPFQPSSKTLPFQPLMSVQASVSTPLQRPQVTPTPALDVKGPEIIPTFPPVAASTSVPTPTLAPTVGRSASPTRSVPAPAQPAPVAPQQTISEQTKQIRRIKTPTPTDE